MTLPPPPPLDVQAYHVDEFGLRALDEYDPERPSRGAFDIDFDIHQHSEDPKAFRITMRIKFAERGYTAEENPPYTITLTITGYFVFAEETPNSVMERMIDINGASILYGIARGFVGQATGASRHDQFVLPAVNFIELVKARAASASEGVAEPQNEGVPSGAPEAPAKQS